MNYRLICQILGRVVAVEAILLTVPMIVAAIYHESILPFLYTILIAWFVALLLMRTKARSRELFALEGFVVVALAWIIMSAIGALPFVFSGEIPKFVDAFFETVSGFTTTGASVLTDVEAMGKSTMFWR